MAGATRVSSEAPSQQGRRPELHDQALPRGEPACAGHCGHTALVARPHRQLGPRLVEHALLEAQLVDEGRQVPARPPALRRKLLRGARHSMLLSRPAPAARQTSSGPVGYIRQSGAHGRATLAAKWCIKWGRGLRGSVVQVRACAAK